MRYNASDECIYMDKYYDELWDDYCDYRRDLFYKEFRPIEEFPGYYVSFTGEVCHYIPRLRKWYMLKNKKMDKEGHVGVMLRKNGKNYYRYTHRLVAQAFIDNPENYPIVRHMNNHPDEPDVMNLAWGTTRDNWEDSVRAGTYRPFTDEDREKSYQKNRKPVVTTVLATGQKKWFRSIAEAARYYGVQAANAQKVVSGERPHTCGIYFEYDRRCDDGM